MRFEWPAYKLSRVRKNLLVSKTGLKIWLEWDFDSESSRVKPKFDWFLNLTIRQSTNWRKINTVVIGEMSTSFLHSTIILTLVTVRHTVPKNVVKIPTIFCIVILNFHERWYFIIGFLMYFFLLNFPFLYGFK